ncbi:MAG: L-seryl-tRNA(Sec) selenium transferase [Pseudomonadota bacterium]
MQKKPKSEFAKLPSVDRLLTSDGARVLVEQHGHDAVVAAARDHLAKLRSAIRDGASLHVSTSEMLTDIAERLARSAAPSLRPVFNLTGTVLHTNLGRAFLPEDAIAEIVDVARGASNLEYDLAAGQRGDRDSHLDDLVCEITGAEAATVVNNNAAAVMLVLNTLAIGKEVPVSRGELVEIGGSFRIPDIMARSGCRLVEVGTTNRTHLKDFASAIGPDTAMIMKVHTSNYIIQGFTKEVPEPDIAELCHTHDLPFVNDLGSGTLANLEDYGLPHEPTPMDALKDGADIVTFSGDKLLGGPQAGLIVGRKDLIARIKSNPMKRALRCDKMTIAALSAVMRLYRDPARLADRLPVLKALARPEADIRSMAESILENVQQAIGSSADASTMPCESEIGSGALPTRTIASYGIAIKPKTKGKSGHGTRLNRIADAFRGLPLPVIGRIQDDTFVLDLRCLSDEAAFTAQLSKLDIKQ